LTWEDFSSQSRLFQVFRDQRIAVKSGNPFQLSIDRLFPPPAPNMPLFFRGGQHRNLFGLTAYRVLITTLVNHPDQQTQQVANTIHREVNQFLRDNVAHLPLITSAGYHFSRNERNLHKLHFGRNEALCL